MHMCDVREKQILKTHKNLFYKKSTYQNLACLRLRVDSLRERSLTQENTRLADRVPAQLESSKPQRPRTLRKASLWVARHSTDSTHNLPLLRLFPARNEGFGQKRSISLRLDYDEKWHRCLHDRLYGRTQYLPLLRLFSGTECILSRETPDFTMQWF